MRKLIFAAIFLFLLPLVIADDLYDSFDDGNLNNNYFSYIRDTCDGGDAWGESGGQTTASCLFSSQSWDLGFQVKNLYNWSATSLNFTVSWNTTGSNLYGFRIGWAQDSNVSDGTGGNQIPFGEAVIDYNTSVIDVNISWLPNSTGISIYKNSVKIKSLPFNATGAVPMLWIMGGSGETTRITLKEVRSTNTSAAAPAALVVTLNSPVDNSVVVNTSLTFNATLTPTNSNLSNATIYLWNSSGALFNATVNNIKGNIANSTTWTINNITAGAYKWNVYGCIINATGSSCLFGTNRTFTNGYRINSETWNNNTYSLMNNRFEINITYDSNSYNGVSATLVYNDTEYATSQSGSDNVIIFSSIVTPIVNTNINKTFYWKLTFASSTISNLLSNTDNRTQLIQYVSLDNCTSNPVKILNLTMYDEDSQSYIAPSVNMNTTIDIDVQLRPYASYSEYINFSVSQSNNPVTICLNDGVLNTSSYSLNAQIKYLSDTRTTEYYHIQNYSLTNLTIPNHIDLYDLLTVNAQEFLLTYRDVNFIPVPDALIEIQRLYVHKGQFYVAEIPKTDADGRAIGQFILNDVVYTIVVKKNGKTLSTFNNIRVYCATSDCRLALDARGSTNYPTNVKVDRNISYTTNYNASTYIYQITYSTLDNIAKSVNLTLKNFDASGNITICSQALTSISGNIPCTIPALYRNSTIIATVTLDGDLLFNEIFNARGSLTDLLGKFRFLLAALLILMIVMMGVSSGMPILIFFVIGMVLAGATYLLNLGTIYGGTSIIIWVIVAAGIIIWKQNRGQNG